MALKGSDCVEVRNVIVNDPVALENWNTVKDSLVQYPVDLLKINQMLKYHDYHEAILQTIQLWCSAEENPTWAKFINVMRQFELNSLAEKLEELAIQKNALRVRGFGDHNQLVQQRLYLSGDSRVANENSVSTRPSEVDNSRTQQRLNSSGDSRVANENSVSTRPSEVDNSTTQQRLNPSGDSRAANENSVSTRPSEVDNSRSIHTHHWVISLARKPDSKNFQGQHAFIILEGIVEDSASIWFIDLVAGSGLGAGIGNYPGKIRMFHKMENLRTYVNVEHRYKLLFSCDKELMTLNPNEELLARSWEISSTKANALVDNVEWAISNKLFPKFHITGKNSALAIGSGSSSSAEAGHNCFTWAKSQLKTLREPSIDDVLNSQNSWDKIVFAVL